MELWLEPRRFGPLRVAGAAVGFAGLLLFMNPGLVDWTDRRVLLGNFLLLVAANCWAAASVLYRRRAWRSGFWAQTLWQIVVSVPPIAVLALPGALGHPVHWTATLFAILAYNWVITTALGYFLWNKILFVMPAGVAGQVLALTPIGGFLLSVLIFGGSVSAEIVLSIVLIVGGIMLTLRATEGRSR